MKSRDKQLPPLSPAETEVLRLLWQSAPATVQNIFDALPAERPLAYATVQTLLRRLEKKGYVQHRVRGKAHVFSPAVTREAVIRRTVKDFVRRLFGNDPLPLMLHLADHSILSPEDVERLRALVKKYSDRSKGD